jgi:hypothetical protein
MKYNITKSDEQKYVWFRVAKCATRTTLNYLHENTKLDFGFPLYLRKDTGMDKPYKSEYDNYFKFTLVRNPWDRILSFYLNKIHGKDVLSGNFGTYPDFSDCKTFRDAILVLTTKNIEDCNYHYRLQTKSFPSDNIDFIGRCENFQEDFNTICDKIGIPKQKLPHLNKTKHKSYTEYYDDETKQIVAEKYAKDIEYFGYEFGE